MTGYSVANWNERPTWIYVIVCSGGKNGRKIAGDLVEWSPGSGQEQVSGVKALTFECDYNKNGYDGFGRPF